MSENRQAVIDALRAELCRLAVAGAGGQNASLNRIIIQELIKGRAGQDA